MPGSTCWAPPDADVTNQSSAATTRADRLQPNTTRSLLVRRRRGLRRGRPFRFRIEVQDRLFRKVSTIDDCPFLHDKIDLSHVRNVAQRIRPQDEEVGGLARLERAEVGSAARF